MFLILSSPQVGDDNPSGIFFSSAYHFVALFRARFAWSDVANLLMQNLCIAPAVFRVTLIVGLGTMLTVGVVALVVGIDGREIKDVRLRPPAATDLRFVSGHTVEVSAVVDASITWGRGINWPLLPLANHHLLASIQTLGEREFTRPHRLRHR